MALVPFPGGAAGPARYEDPDDASLEAEDGAGGKMSFLEHLEELRRRLILSLVAVGVGFGVALAFIGYIFQFIMRPLVETMPAGGRLIYTEPTEAFLLQLKVAALVGLIIAAPAVLWQLWLFVAPGLYRREKRFAIPFVLAASLLFAAGAAFNHFVVFRVAFAFLGGFGTEYLEFLPRIQPVFSLYARMTIAFGLAFQMPVLVFTLARLGLVNARLLVRHAKYAILVIAIFAAFLTPPDVVSQVLMGVPMLVLYALSIGIAWLFGPPAPRDE